MPNGWTITPAGTQVPLSDLPLNLFPLPDSKQALAATSGYNRHELSLIDLTRGKVISRRGVRESWFGLACDAGSGKVWWSGGGSDMLHTFALKNGKLKTTSHAEPDPSKMTKEELARYQKERPKRRGFKSGLALDVKNRLLYSLDINAAASSSRRRSIPPCSRRGPRAAIPMRWLSPPMVELPIRVILSGNTMGTLALVNFAVGHDELRILLARLALDQSVQGQGLGEFLLADALRRCLFHAEQLGVHAALVEAIDDEAKAFYQRYGFVALQDDPLHLYLPMATIEDAFGTGAGR